MAKQTRPSLVVMNASPVLITESAEKFSRLHDRLKDDFKPRGTIEAIKVKEMADLIWETHRYRRAKTAIINAAFRLALESLLKGVCRERFDAAALADRWFSTDEKAKQEVLEKLSHFGLDERAIEAESIRIRASEIETLDRLEASLTWRFDKAVRFFAEFRGALGQNLRKTAERVIEGEILALGTAAKKPPPAAA